MFTLYLSQSYAFEERKVGVRTHSHRAPVTVTKLLNWRALSIITFELQIAFADYTAISVNGP